MMDLTPFAHQEPILVYDRIVQNRRKTWLLLAGLALVVLPFWLFIAAIFGELILMNVAILSSYWGWLPELPESEKSPLTVFALSSAASLVLALIVAYTTYYLAATMALSTSGARPLAADEERRLRRIVENLCIGAGLPQPRLYVIESPATNAYSTGYDPEHAALVVTRGLLDALDDRELEGVVAQELSQIGNEDVRPGTLAGAVAMILCPVFLVLFIIKGFLPRLFRRGRIVGIAVLIVLSPVLLALLWLALTQLLMVALLPLILPALLSLPLEEMSSAFTDDPRVLLSFGMLFALPLYLFYVAPVSGFLMRRAVCRQHEFRADADALLLTRHPSGLPRALIKMTTGGKATFRMDPTVSHLYVVDPLQPKLWSRVFATQPPVEERLAALVRMTGIDPRELQEFAHAVKSSPQEVVGSIPISSTNPPSDSVTPDEVLRAIERAWADATPPGPDDLTGRPSRIGEYGYVAGFFRGKRWRDVDLRSLRDHYPGPHDACLSFMSGRAFRHFLPSYMRIAILDREVMDSAVDAAVAALTPPRYRPEVDRIAREAHEEAARREPGLEALALHRAGGTTPEAVHALRAWWDERVAGFTPAQREAIVTFLEFADESLGDPLAGEALEHWRRQAVSGGDGTER